MLQTNKMNLLSLAVLLLSSCSQVEMILQELPPSIYPLAKCNDGTQANYHVTTNPGKGKILISLQGGGTCDSVEGCIDRCETTNLCTADTHQLVDEDLPGHSLAGDPFQDYMQVRVHYCSSDTWSGTREASEETGGYHFYGKHIFEAVVQDLDLNFNLLEATHIVLTGGSAGAQGVAFRCDDFFEWVKSNNPSINVKCMPDSPEFYPPEVHTEGCPSRDPGYQNYLTKFWGRVEDASCLEYAKAAGVENVGELCGVAARFTQFITSPLLILTTHEDAVFTSVFGCQPGPAQPDHEQFKVEWMAAHSELVMEYMADFPQIAFFAPNCRTHVIMYHPEISVVEEESGELVDVNTFISHWLEGEGRNHANDEVTVENPTCQG